jgi:hypothetical protein
VLDRDHQQRFDYSADFDFARDRPQRRDYGYQLGRWIGTSVAANMLGVVFVSSANLGWSRSNCLALQSGVNSGTGQSLAIQSVVQMTHYSSPPN